MRIAFEFRVAGVAEVDRFFEVKEMRVKDLRGAWPATDAVFSDIMTKQFDSEGAHGGTPWKELAPATQKERARLGFGPAHPILERTGLLRDSFTNPGHADAISEHGQWRWVRGSRSPHAPGAHQRGGVKLPQRRIVELNSDDRHRLLRPLRNWVTGNDPWAGLQLGSSFGRFFNLSAA